MMNILVTGGAGFIGSHLVRKLIKLRHKVWIVDDLSTGRIENLSNVPYSGVLNCKSSEYINHANTKFDVIFHLGMPSSSPIYRKDRQNICEVVKGTINLLELAAYHDSKFVLISSSSLYNGNPTPWKEDMPVSVSDFYTEARYYAERLVMLYNKMYGVRYTILRLFSVYGPGEESKKQYANLLSQYMWSLQKKEEFEIYGDGEQKRDFIYVSDVVSAMIKSMPRNRTGIFNVGTGKSNFINQMTNKVTRHMLAGKDKYSVTKYVENPIKNYVPDTLADTDKARKILGFESRVSIDEGIKKCLENSHAYT